MTTDPGSPATALWEIAEEFRRGVTSELSAVSPESRLSLRGDYLFIVDSSPRFVVIVERENAWSGNIQGEGEHQTLELPQACPVTYDAATRSALLSGGARATVRTDSATLRALLVGALKARQAFLASRVSIEGDLPGFLRLVSLLRGRGVGPVSRA